MKIAYIKKCEECGAMMFTEYDSKYKCEKVDFAEIEDVNKIPKWCPLADSGPVYP